MCRVSISCELEKRALDTSYVCRHQYHVSRIIALEVCRLLFYDCSFLLYHWIVRILI